jgi:hypothetical protein
MTRTRKIVVTAILAPIVISTALIGSCEWTRRRYERGFAQISAGDDKAKVVELLGEPTSVENCRGAERCKDIYVYYSFMGKWSFVLDGDEKVVTSYHSASP